MWNTGDRLVFIIFHCPYDDIHQHTKAEYYVPKIGKEGGGRREVDIVQPWHEKKNSHGLFSRGGAVTVILAEM